MTASEVLAPPQATELGAPGNASAPHERVLLVDDRLDNLVALEAVLEPLGLELLTASSGVEALRLLLDQPVAAIILDVLMPDMDGFETASLVRSRSATRAVPIMFLSAVAHSLEYEIRGYEAGGIAYICKPFEPTALRARLRMLLDWSADLRAMRHDAGATEAAGDHGLSPSAEGPRSAPARRDSQQDLQPLRRLLELTVEPDSHAPAEARAAVRGALRDSGSLTVDTTELLVSELVTNALVHGQTACRLCLDAGPTLVRVTVEDGRDHGPELMPVSIDAERGRGLQLVRVLASRCGWTRHPAGKTVWFELDLGS